MHLTDDTKTTALHYKTYNNVCWTSQLSERYALCRNRFKVTKANVQVNMGSWWLRQQTFTWLNSCHKQTVAITGYR